MSSPGHASDLSKASSKTHLTSPHPLYQWKPLSNPSNQIRLLMILPSIDSDEIRCTLKETQLIQDPPPLQRYRALSYVWGDPKDRLPITIVEGDELFTFHVTRNLFAAITDLRRPSNAGARNIATPPDGVYRVPNFGTDPLCLWVDAICIDQGNDDERSAQVQIMGEIYARSCGALVWLGPSPENGTILRGLDAALRIATYQQQTETYWLDTDENYFAMKELFLLPWWSRVWVIQEIVFAPDSEFVWGDFHTSWGTLRDALHNAGLVVKYSSRAHTKRANELHSLATEFIQMDELKQNFGWFVVKGRDKLPRISNNARPPIDTLLWEFRSREASIEHDKLYALLSLADGSINIVPDYRRPIESVLCELAKALITREPNPSFPLDHIGFAYNAKRTLHNRLPSWVPDWTPSRKGVEFLEHYDPFISPFGADGSILSRFPSILRDILTQKFWQLFQLPVLGIELGHLTQLSCLNSIDIDLDEWARLIRSWALFSSKSNNDAFLRTVLSDRLSDRRTRIPDRVLLDREGILPQGWYLKLLGHNLQRDLLPLELVERLAKAAQGWKIGHISGKHLALLPSNSTTNDLIFVPVGSSTPFVLRSTGARDGSGIMQYRLVGRCYVHGFMDGEAMSEIRTILEKLELERVSDEEKKSILLAQLKTLVLV